jgi:hypothetical protein
MIRLEWEPDPEGGTDAIRATVPGLTWDGVTIGQYVFRAVARPHYCDRGAWLVHLETSGALDFDECDGFPRFFFRLENLKDEMQAWANKRGPCLRAAEILAKRPA